MKVLCGGCFNEIHKGHVYFLKKAKSLGDYLIVILAHDKTNRKKYGRNAILAKIRKKNLEKLRIADKVVVGSYPANYKKMIKRLKPDIVALGHDQNIELGMTGLRIVRIPKLFLSGKKK